MILLSFSKDLTMPSSQVPSKTVPGLHASAYRVSIALYDAGTFDSLIAIEFPSKVIGVMIWFTLALELNISLQIATYAFAIHWTTLKRRFIHP
jgi:hypothetical protein